MDMISLNSFTGFSAPQTLKLIGYIKHRKFIILVDSGNTHNFIHRLLSQKINCYIFAFNNFQIMIANGGSMKCGERCENVCLQIGEYNLKYHMFSIDMGGCDIMLGVEWICTMGPITSDPPEVGPLISLNSFTGFSAPQTLKLIGYIKHRKFIILVESSNTHNFIHHRLTQEINCYICAFNNFQIMISNGGSMKCGGRCENVFLQIGEYNFKSHMFSIDMGGCDIILGVEWIHTLAPITMDFKNLTMQF
jgi:3-dehydroquinate synthetase